jgi:type II secretory pathway pseudopilin PulG
MPGNRLKFNRSGYTLVEMLTTIATLIIVLGIMVALARYVRAQSADELTKSMLRELDALMNEYQLRTGSPVTTIHPLTDPQSPVPLSEQELQQNARKNNQQIVALLKSHFARPVTGEEASNMTRNRSPFGDLPIGLYDEVTLRDAWGTPIVFMPDMHREIGMAPSNRPYFFFSAGPDGRYLTREDNLYSYELSPPARSETPR